MGTGVAGDRQKEAIEINRSLSALGDVISAVADKRNQVPYRNHKLTQLLADSLGGTAKTLMIVNCSPACTGIHQTMASLKYAARVKRVTNAGAASRPWLLGSKVNAPAPGSRTKGSTE